MKKILLTFILFLLTWTVSYAQVQTLTEVDYLHNISRTGEPVWERNDIKGTPFLFDKWHPAEIITKDNRKLEVAEINYNAKQQKFYYKQNGSYYEIFPGQVKVIHVIGKKHTRHFVPVLPAPVDDKRTFAFYEIFDDPGKAFVAVGFYKKLEPADKSQSYASDKSMQVMKYSAKKRVYVLVNGRFIKRPSFNKLLKLLHASKDMRKKIKQFIRSGNLHYTKPADLQKIMAYYYSQK